LSDPARPAVLEVSLLSGGITVTGWDGKEVVVQVDAGGSDSEDEMDVEVESDPDDRSRGLRRIPNLAAGLEIEEGDNVVTVSSHNHRNMDLAIQVPRATTIRLSTINDGDIVVRDVSGEIIATNTNGDILLHKVSGAAVIDALNGEIDAELLRIDPKKSYSFSSLNGDIDLTLPADARVELRIKTDNGEIYTDFDLQLGAKTSEVEPEEDKASRKKKRRYGFETSMVGTLNGGGSLLRLQTFNGSIYIRKAK
jgi:DUF4097 and DUF4098 domain-containing protein YvlB